MQNLSGGGPNDFIQKSPWVFFQNNYFNGVKAINDIFVSVQKIMALIET